MVYLASLEERIDDKLSRYIFIHTKHELDKVVTDNRHNNRVIIDSGFANKFFTPTGLVSYVDNARRLNHNLIIETELSDFTSMDKIIRDITEFRDIGDLYDLMSIRDNEFYDTLKHLAKDYNQDKSSMLEYSNQIAQLIDTIDNLTMQLKQKDFDLQVESNNRLSYESKFHSLISRINYQYDLKIDPNKLFKADKNSYDKILYIKELSRVQYTDTLIYNLQQILKVMYGMPTRIVVIESYYASSKIKQYPNLVPHHILTENDVLRGDILMLGMQPNIMNDILRNASNISILIVLDRAGYEEPHIEGPNVELLYSVSDIGDAPEGVENERLISYSNKTQFIKYIKGFNDLNSSQKMSEYSSMSIVKNIIALLQTGGS